LNHRPRKRFGQNFLHDPVVIGKIVSAVNPASKDTLFEIGPGQGAITVPLLAAAGELSVVELDRDLIGPLQLQCAGIGNLVIHNADALTFDFGNLPYNISTPLLFHLLQQHHCIKDMHFMLQKEVVDRMAASPGSRQYGRLSIMLQYRCKVMPLFNIGPEAFDPPPKVESAFVRLEPYKQPRVQVTDEALFEKLVKQAFSQRRKTLRNTLRDMVDAGAMTELGIDPSARAETLAIEDFAALANHLCNT
jgi:16S rRNA (adenine1518-N6/adenine1519-N6)-dimethyltransferase